MQNNKNQNSKIWNCREERSDAREENFESARLDQVNLSPLSIDSQFPRINTHTGNYLHLEAPAIQGSRDPTLWAQLHFFCVPCEGGASSPGASHGLFAGAR